nr:hypothetical protein GCM10020093_086850 [Planobispora longispora]
MCGIAPVSQMLPCASSTTVNGVSVASYAAASSPSTLIESAPFKVTSPVTSLSAPLSRRLLGAASERVVSGAGDSGTADCEASGVAAEDSWAVGCGAWDAAAEAEGGLGPSLLRRAGRQAHRESGRQQDAGYLQSSVHGLTIPRMPVNTHITRNSGIHGIPGRAASPARHRAGPDSRHRARPGFARRRTAHAAAVPRILVSEGSPEAVTMDSGLILLVFLAFLFAWG